MIAENYTYLKTYQALRKGLKLATCGVNGQSKLKFIAPLRESRDKVDKSAFPDRTSKNLHENLLSNGGISTNNMDRILTNFR